MTKKEIRKIIYAKRNELSDIEYENLNDELFSKIREFIYENKSVFDSKIVFLYASYGKEADTNKLFELLKTEKKQIAYPLITNRDNRAMSFFEVNDMDQLREGFKGIREPIGKVNCDELAKNAIMLVPLVAFSTDCKRVGYGGGFYDTYFSKYESKIKIGIGFEFQKVDYIKTDEHDIVLDYIITEKNVYGGKHE